MESDGRTLGLARRSRRSAAVHHPCITRAAFDRFLQHRLQVQTHGRAKGLASREESGLQACYGKSPGNGAFSMNPIRRRRD
jgi:hypothetical protein